MAESSSVFSHPVLAECSAAICLLAVAPVSPHQHVNLLPWALTEITAKEVRCSTENNGWGGCSVAVTRHCVCAVEKRGRILVHVATPALSVFQEEIQIEMFWVSMSYLYYKSCLQRSTLHCALNLIPSSQITNDEPCKSPSFILVKCM